MNKKIIIIGAGLSGLSCAYHLKRNYELYEKESVAGGSCRSTTLNGFSFDFAGHLLHFKTPYALHLVKKLLGNNIIEHSRHSYIFSNNKFSPYPFQANTYRLPRHITKECLAGLVHKSNGKLQPKNFYEWMLKNFGKGTVKHFMLPYNQKFWRQHPRYLTCEWLDGKIPVPSLSDSIAGAFAHSEKTWGYNARFWYPKKGGIEVLAEAFQKHIKNISFNHELKRIDIKNRCIKFENGFSKKFDFLIVTIPLVELASIIHPIPEKIKSAFRRLSYISIINHNVGISRRCMRNKNWIYFPEGKFAFYRIGSFSSFSHHAAPPGHSSLYIEVSSKKGTDPRKNHDLIDRIEDDLIRLRLISRKEEIVARNTNFIKHGYIVYNHNYSAARKMLLKFLRNNKIFPIGRFGSWRYLTMEESIIDGQNTARHLNC